jgi:proteasome lid subunit RPN8/RPN11
MSRKQRDPVTLAKAASMEPIVKIDSEVTRRIRQHARAHLKTEVCGVLIGESTDEAIDIHASIEALNAAQAGTHVTFTQDAWEEIYKVKDEQYPDARIVGWYHSHPGFGIFLSEHDLFIQENFFSSPGQVAWVYDPHSDDEGCFGWVDGKVARLTSIATLYQSGEPVEHAANNYVETEMDEEEPASTKTQEAAPAWMHWSQTALTHLMVLLAGFAIAYFLLPRYLAILPDPATGQVMVVDYNQLRAFFKGTGPMPKPVDVMSLPVPGPASSASSVPSANGQAPATSPSPAAPTAQPKTPETTQPAKPEAKK